MTEAGKRLLVCIVEEDLPLLLEPRERFDQCLIGIAERFTSTFAVYSKSCVLRVLAEDAADEESPEESALDHFDYNILGGWVGEGTPAFINDDIKASPTQ